MGFKQVIKPEEEEEHHTEIKVDTKAHIGPVQCESSKTDKEEENEIQVQEKNDYYEE